MVVGMKLLLTSAYIFALSLCFCAAVGNVPTIANDFVFTFLNAYMKDDIPPSNPSGVYLLVIVSNNNDGTAHVNVTSPYKAFSTQVFSVAPHSIFKLPITQTIEDQFPGYNMSNDGRIVVEDKGIRVQSDLPVAVYAHAELYEGLSADSFLVLPTVHLGRQYSAVTATSMGRPNLIPNMIAVVAFQDNTQVTIGNQTVTINALQVASIATHSILSGTMISGNKPFAAISGNTCGWNVDTEQYCDYEAVMLLPVSAWGLQFAAIPFANLTANYYQMVANTNNTVITVVGNATPIAILNAGEYRVFRVGTSLITSNNPIQLIQLGQDTGDAQTGFGDPFFVQLPSIDK